MIRITEVVPLAPPCFASRTAWLEYVQAADLAHMESENPGTGPMVSRSATSEFNPRFNFCRDCNSAYAAAMTREGRCEPLWLQEGATA